MQQLLDTHVLIWFLRGDATLLSPRARAAIETPNIQNRVSMVSLWEMAIKSSLGKLDIGRAFSSVYQDIETNGFQLLPLDFKHLQQLHALPFHHRDPFDRLLIAQAMTENMRFISADTMMSSYNVELLW